MKFKYVYLALSIIFVGVGLGAMFMGHQTPTSSMIEGMSKGLGGVFFILFFIFLLFGKQPLDKTGGH